MKPEISQMIHLPDIGPAIFVVIVGAAFVVAILFVVGFALTNRPH